MSKNIEEYLDLLRDELNDADSAIMQDALSDAEEHLRTALSSAQESNPEGRAADLLPAIIEDYGTPDEIADAYRDFDERFPPLLAAVTQVDNRSIGEKIFGVIADPKAWGAVLYMLLSLVTGTLYFSWAVTGLSTSIGIAILIIGVPFAILFLISVRGLALLEGRLVEALLGVRMPRRQVFYDRSLDWKQKLTKLVTDKHTWLSILYLILQLPLGILYFTAIVTFGSLGVGLIAAPFAQGIFGLPIISMGTQIYYVPVWLMPFVVLLGAFILLATLHLAKLVGRLHGNYAKWILVRD